MTHRHSSNDNTTPTCPDLIVQHAGDEFGPWQPALPAVGLLCSHKGGPKSAPYSVNVCSLFPGGLDDEYLDAVTVANCDDAGTARALSRSFARSPKLMPEHGVENAVYVVVNNEVGDEIFKWEIGHLGQEAGATVMAASA